MKDKAYLKALVAWNKWANEVTYAKVAELPEEEVFKERKTMLRSIFVSLHHLLNVDDIWLHHMQGTPHDHTDVRGVRFEDFATLRKEREAMDLKLEAYLESVSEASLEEIVDYTLVFGGKTGAMSRAMCLTHLILHGSYHRGWISDMFGQAGALQPTTDLPVFARTLAEQGSSLP
mmetsp:Transcript_20199/g.62463  ORF Transcript_20199/g.62463 Transcript_20199/m.62463 type:complete len:175 (-) Transcript_20199:237-761(-)